MTEIIKKLRQKNKITLLTSYSNDVPSIFYFLSSKAHQSKNEKKKLTIGKMILNLPEHTQKLILYSSIYITIFHLSTVAAIPISFPKSSSSPKITASTPKKHIEHGITENTEINGPRK